MARDIRAQAEYHAIDPPQPIPESEFREPRLAQAFVAEWIWFGGPREEIAIEAERYQRLAMGQ